MLPAWRIIQAHVYSVYVVVAWTLTHSQCPASHIGWETGFVTSEGKEWDTNTGRTKTFCCCLLSVTCKTSCMLWAFPCCLAYWCLLKMEKHLRNLRKMQTRTRRKTKSRTGIFLSFWAFLMHQMTCQLSYIRAKISHCTHDMSQSCFFTSADFTVR